MISLHKCYVTGLGFKLAPLTAIHIWSPVTTKAWVKVKIFEKPENFGWGPEPLVGPGQSPGRGPRSS